MPLFMSEKKLRSLVRQEAELVVKESQRLVIITRISSGVTHVGIPCNLLQYYGYLQQETSVTDILTRILYALKELGFEIVVSPEKSASWEIKKK